MNNRPDENAHFVAKKRQYIKRKKNKRMAILAVLCVAIAIVWVMIICVVKDFSKAYSPAVTTTETDAVTTAAPITEIVTERGSYYENAVTVEMAFTHDDVFRGSLVLVSDHLGYALPKNAPELVTVWGNKSPTYYVATSSLQLAKDAFSAADKMFCDYSAENSNSDYQITMGYDPADAPACCSEHGTGYAFDMNVYTKSGASFRLAEAGGIYNWIYENCAKYGFVLRYGREKTNVTGEAFDADHFRYVGKGHAQYMSEHGMALEEYIGELQKHVYGKKHLEFSYDSVEYEAFYVNIPNDAESVTVNIPQDVSYTVSGDNIGGVIITLHN